MTSLKDVTKQCSNCERTLHSSAFRYVQSKPDHLDHICLRCRSWKGDAFPELHEVEEGEIWFRNLVDEAKSEFDPETDRLQFEKLLLLILTEEGYLDKWKEPLWLDDQLLERM